MTTERHLEENISLLINKAVENHRSGKLDDAESIYRQILSTNSNKISQIKHVIFTDFGNLLLKQNNIKEAIECYKKSIEINPNHADVYNNLGHALQQQGDLEKAIDYYKKSIKANPEFILAYNNLAKAFIQQGNLDIAIEQYRKILEIKPEDGEVCNNFASMLKQQGRLKESVHYYQLAIKNNPDYAEAYNNLGNIYKEQGELDNAAQLYQQALKLKPNLAEAYKNLGSTFRQQGKLEEATELYQQALKLNPNFADAEFGLCINQIPIIYANVDEIQLRRNSYQKHLQQLAERYQLATPQQRAIAANAVGAMQPFYLAYQGLNDRDLQKTYGEMICQIMSSRYPQWSHKLPLPNLEPNEKIRVGFISGYFNHHSVWKIPMKGWVENLDKDKFELFGYYTDFKRDQETIAATQSFSKFIQGPLSVQKWGQIISEDKLHVLIFPEFGMDPMTIKLGCLRLAPIQLVFGGHPETSGLPTMDHHLSSDLMEPENAQEHYTEKLVRLPNLAVNYTLLDIPKAEINKKKLGIKDDEIIFWCCQSLFKYLPQNDDIFPRIAQELGRCKFVFIQYENKGVTGVFIQRLERIFEEFGLNCQHYCLFLPRLKSNYFAGVTAIADIFLDNIGWSGNNTVMECTAHNLPIVTFPQDLMRGRHAMAILKMMGIEETIADSKEAYVNIAVRLGRDSGYRQYISQKIAANKHKLYGDKAPVEALEKFILNVVKKNQN